MLNLPNIIQQDIDAVKRLSVDDRDNLKAEINSADPHTVFTAAGDSNNPNKRKIICPNCGNGTGSDKTPVEVELKGDRWLYNCFKCNDFSGDLLKIIADAGHLNLHDFNDMCKALAIGANLIGFPLDFSNHQTKSAPNNDIKPIYSSKDALKEHELILADIAQARKRLKELPFLQRRGLSFETYQHFGCGYLPDWTPPKSRVAGINPPSSRRYIIPTPNQYNAALLPDDRSRTEKKYWKMHAGKLELFNSRVVPFSDVLFVLEGEFDVMSIFQATKGKVGAVAVLGAANWQKTLKPYFSDFAKSKKKIIILFDADDTGKKNAENLRGELLKNKIPAVCRFLFDYLSSENQQKFGEKVDANDILQNKKLGEQELNRILDKIEIDTRADFELVEKEFATRADDSISNDKNNDEIIYKEIRKQCVWSKDRNGHPTKIKDWVINYEKIFYNDPKLIGLFGRDDFRQEIVFKRRAPWHSKHAPLKDSWEDSDDSELRLYLAKHFAEMGTNQRTLDFINRIARENSFHGIRQFLDNLPKWDGTPRLENLFVKFLGAEDSTYTHEVTKHLFLGAIARALNPGCDFQEVVVLQGAQGIGKSRMLRMLGGKHGVNPTGESWHVALRDQLDDSHAVDAMRKGWVIELEEFAATSRTDVNAMKGVLSADDVTRRFAYDRRAKTIKAHWVFVGTTNDDSPLRDQTGNRRFLPIKCHNKESTIVDGMTPEYIRLVLAEAYHIYKEMFPTVDDFDADKLRLPVKIQRIAAQKAAGITQDDGLTTEIRGFVDSLILPDYIWHLLSREERRKFFANSGCLIMKDAVTELEFRRRARGGNPDNVQHDVDLISAYIENGGENENGEDTIWIEEIPRGKDNAPDQIYHINGTQPREHICAAEIFNECFGSDNRKRMNRISEILSRLEGWHIGERLQKIDPHYKDQKIVYYRDNNIKGS